MKKWYSASNLLLITVIAYVLYQKVPIWIDEHQKQGLKITSKTYKAMTLNGETQNVVFPSPDKNTLAIFWATWCGPCKLEMKRLKTSVEQGKRPRNSIFAINSHESLELQKKHIDENSYPFLFIQDEELTKKLEIMVTPTTALFKKNILEDLSSGISLIGIKKAEVFLTEE
ncbi:MAG: TlpA family protein disulfide reductase [Bdellovibrionales bacterium]|nr:TlpA family protein disulfide reductase [Bdellovibrionales bacterium]